MKPVIMPQIGQDIPAGKIVQWLKEEGEGVRKGEAILVVESEKASFEVEAEADGVLLRILHKVGDEVEILKPVAYLGGPGEALAEEAAAAAPAEARPAETQTVPVSFAPAPSAEAGGKAPASPAARRLAREKGLDLARIKGKGPGGRITEQDVLAALTAPAMTAPQYATPDGASAPAGPAGDTVVPYGRMRKRLAARLAASTQTIPHFYLSLDVDMTEAQAWRRKFNERHGVHVTVTDLVVKATAAALRNVPRLNAHADADRMVLKAGIHVGVAVAVEEGLLVPVIPDADKKSLREIADLVRTSAEAARRGIVNPSAPGTFTVTSLGMFGVGAFLPIINPPEVAILAVGAIQPRPAAVGRELAVRDMMTLTLACDHRAVDGAEAAALLGEIKRNLEEIQNPSAAWI
jgi:pyruvate dehydrogenase E2 component (dihydrolipoamide acetyltransferase)